MGVSAIHIAGAALGLMVVCSTAYYLGVCYSAWRFRRDRKSDSLRDARSAAAPLLSALEPLSVLKPLSDSAPGLDENLRTHALQNYPKFELLFGASNASDPAAEAVQRLAAEFPHLSIELVECGHSPEGNPKVLFSKNWRKRRVTIYCSSTTATSASGVVTSGGSWRISPRTGPAW